MNERRCREAVATVMQALEPTQTAHPDRADGVFELNRVKPTTRRN